VQKFKSFVKTWGRYPRDVSKGIRFSYRPHNLTFQLTQPKIIHVFPFPPLSKLNMPPSQRLTLLTIRSSFDWRNWSEILLRLISHIRIFSHGVFYEIPVECVRQEEPNCGFLEQNMTALLRQVFPTTVEQGTGFIHLVCEYPVGTRLQPHYTVLFSGRSSFTGWYLYSVRNVVLR